MTVPMAIGLAVMIGSETATLAGVDVFRSWNTPLCWTGFILFADSVVWQQRRRSWLRSAPREFVALALLSIPLWLVFEFFNLYLRNWYYVGLPASVVLRQLGYAWSFATIWPAIFEAAELCAVWRHRLPEPERPDGHEPLPAALAVGSIVCGAAMLAWPLVASAELARYLAAPVWLGFILLLDPLNAALSAPSLIGDWRAGRPDRLVNLVLSGFLCGGLWEFWNYWASAKWHYTVPIMEHIKIFEMPLPGYFGFPAFALECFTMYVFVRTIVSRVWFRRGQAPAVHPIAL